MNALDLIENDFKLLLTELKKRTPNLKDVRYPHYYIILNPCSIASRESHKNHI